MKLKVLLLTLSLILSTTTQAAIFVIDPSGKNTICEQVLGHWTGTGKAKLLNGLLTCVYDGKGNITSGKPDEIQLKDLELNVRKKESSPLCPAHEVLELTGECHNGKIIIHTDSAKLDGEFLDEGQKAILNGTVTFTVPILGKVTPDVDVTLYKK